jgi:hypothetical protein
MTNTGFSVHPRWKTKVGFTGTSISAANREGNAEVVEDLDTLDGALIDPRKDSTHDLTSEPAEERVADLVQPFHHCSLGHSERDIIGY